MRTPERDISNDVSPYFGFRIERQYELVLYTDVMLNGKLWECSLQLSAYLDDYEVQGTSLDLSVVLGTKT